MRPGALRSASRAASTPSVVVSSSWEATARVPLPPPLPMKAAISALASRRYGTYPAALMMPRTAIEPNGWPPLYLMGRQIRGGIHGTKSAKGADCPLIWRMRRFPRTSPRPEEANQG